MSRYKLKPRGKAFLKKLDPSIILDDDWVDGQDFDALFKSSRYSQKKL